MSKKISLKFLKNRYVIAGIVVFLIIVGYFVMRGDKGATFESTASTMGDVIEKVSVTGSISPLKKTDLAFKKSGVMTSVPVAVGDRVKRGALIASIDADSDAAALASAQATLDDMSRNLSKEEMAVQSTALSNAKQNAMNAVRTGNTKIQAALINYVDAFFDNPQSVNPTINLTTDSETQKNNINKMRLLVTETLEKWSTALDSLNEDNISKFMTDVDGYELTVKSFMNSMSEIVNNLNTGNSGLSQATIDAYLVSMNTAVSTMNSAIDTVTTAKTALSTAQSSYDLKLAGNSALSIASQRAKVSQLQASLNDNYIFAPIDGVITRADLSVGEFAVSGKSSFATQSDSGYKIEAYVPEADIAKINIENKADVTLDSYGPYVIFGATVVSVDPAETVLEGVPTYKVTLQFDQPDTRIRSGMTANTEIITREVKDVLTVPTRAIVDDAGKKSVRVVDANGKSFTSVPVVVGLKGSSGTTEIISGIKLGDKVVTYVK